MDLLGTLRDRLKIEGSVMFDVKVRPSAARTVIKGILADGTLKIDVAAVPEDGKANAELVRFLAEEFGVGKVNVEVVTGHTSSRKKIRIQLLPPCRQGWAQR